MSYTPEQKRVWAAETGYHRRYYLEHPEKWAAFNERRRAKRAAEKAAGIDLKAAKRAKWAAIAKAAAS